MSSQSQAIAEALELPVGLRTITLVIGKRLFVGRGILSNLLKVTPDWSTSLDQAITKTGAFPHAD